MGSHPLEEERMAIIGELSQVFNEYGTRTVDQ
jgi:hypothetical protein